MQTETTAVDTTTTAAPLVDVNAPPAVAPASAPADDVTTVDTTSTTTAEGDETSKQQEEQERNEKGQYKPGAQKRIDELTFRRHQAEREIARLQQVIASHNKAPAAPKPTDFETDEDYDQAMLDHRIESGVNRNLAKSAQAQVEKFSTEAQSVAAEAYNQRVSEAVTRIPDFVEVVGKSDVPMSAFLREALMDSEKGPELVYHLAKNPALAEQLNAMSVRQMDREIGRLEAAIGATAKPAPPAARTTSAPPPVTPGKQAASPANTDPATMSQAEYEVWRKAQGAKHTG